MGTMVGVLAALVLSCPLPRSSSVVPVAGEVVGRFVAPSCERCAGRRGILVATVAGTTVHATRGGIITFAGAVGGVLWVVQQVAPDVRISYGRLAAIAPGVRAGGEVPTGAPVGVAAGRTHLGLRVGSVYRDPIGCWVGRARLVDQPR